MIHLLLFSLMILCACSSPESDDSPVEQYYVRLLAPEGGGPVSGAARLSVEYAIEGAVQRVEVGVEGEEPVTFDQLMPTLEVDTTTLEDGRVVLAIRVFDDLGHEYADKLEVDVDNPEHRFLGYDAPGVSYAMGDLIELDLEYSEALLDVEADFGQLDTGLQGSAVSAAEGDAGHYLLRYPLSATNEQGDGTYPVELVATNSVGMALRSTIWIQYRGAPALPLVVPGALFSDRSGLAVHLATEGAPRVEAISGPPRIVSGQKATLDVTWSQEPDRPARYLAVQAEGHSGAYLLPVTGTEAAVPLELPPMAADTDLSLLTLLVTAMDDAGETLGSVSHEVQPIPAPTGPLQVLLTWNAPVDLDLEVVTPAGNTIGYVTPAADGGRLLLDSNSMCEIDGYNVETISWLIGQEPSGTYAVRANLYDLCGQQDVDYTVIVHACGVEHTFIGAFTQADYDAGELSHDVGSIKVDCAHRVGGTVTFETSSPGLPTKAPAVGILMQVLDAERNAIASTRTDQQGNYSIPLSPPPAGPYTVVANARWDVPGAAEWGLRVVPRSGDTEHKWESRPIDPASNPGRVEDFYITEAAGSGALNILEFMRQGRQWMIAEGILPKVPLIARWERLTDTPFGGPVACAPRLSGCNDEWALHITGLLSNFDEFDSSVIEHEFGHHLIYSLSRPGSGGGRHGWTERIRASMAWNEGIATALGQDQLGYPQYRDRATNAAGHQYTFEIDLEVGPGPGHPVESVAKGTRQPGGEVSGDMCELIPAMVVWDLLDPATPAGAGSDSHDEIELGRRPAFDALFQSLPKTDWEGRGALGVDLEDFLDEWLCHDSLIQNASRLAPRTAELEAILRERGLAYDFAWSAECG